MRFVISLLNYGLVAIFGILLSAEFSGVSKQKRNIIKLAFFSLIAILIQLLFWSVFGLEITTKLYPFITHLPLFLLLTVVFKRPWLTSFISVLSAYLCRQIPRWIAGLTLYFSNDRLYYCLPHIIALIVTFILFAPLYRKAYAKASFLFPAIHSGAWNSSAYVLYF